MEPASGLTDILADDKRRSDRGLDASGHRRHRQAVFFSQTPGLLRHIGNVNESPSARVSLLCQEVHQTIEKVIAHKGSRTV